MDLIIDANILFSSLIKEGITINIILNQNIRLFAPDFLFNEFLKYKEEILKKTNRDKKEFDEIFIILENLINIIPKEEFIEYLKEAEIIVPDKNDVPYFALALRLKIPIWSNDKRLKNQEKIKIYSTLDIINLLER